MNPRSILSILLATGALLTNPAAALDLNQALALASSAGDAALARAQAALARAQYAEQSYTGDLSLSLDPGYKIVTDDFSQEAKSQALSLSASASVSLGLSAAAAEKAALALAQAEYAAAQAALAEDQARLRAYALYRDAWFAQEDAALAAREAELAEREFAALRARYAAGSVSYAELRKAEDALFAAADAAIASDMRRRIARLELWSWLGVADDGGPLAAAAPEAGALPKAPELAAHALLADPAILDALLKRRLGEEQLARAAGFEPAASFKLSASKDGHAFTASYVLDGARLGLSYSPPPLVLAGPEAAPSPWTVGASLSVALPLGSASALRRDSLEASAEADRIKLEALMAKLSLDVRAAYQAWVRAEAGRDQASRNAESAAELLALVAARAARGGATELELERAGLDAERAALNSLAKAMEAERARMAAALAARYPLSN